MTPQERLANLPPQTRHVFKLVTANPHISVRDLYDLMVDDGSLGKTSLKRLAGLTHYLTARPALLTSEKLAQTTDTGRRHINLYSAVDVDAVDVPQPIGYVRPAPGLGAFTRDWLAAVKDYEEDRKRDQGDTPTPQHKPGASRARQY